MGGEERSNLLLVAVHVVQQWRYYLIHVVLLPYVRLQLVAHGFSNDTLQSLESGSPDAVRYVTLGIITLWSIVPQF